jgi:hypothetical protein
VNFEVIYTVCYDRKSSLLLPTLTHFINTDDLHLVRIPVHSNAPSSVTMKQTTICLINPIIPDNAALECTETRWTKI